MKMTLPKFYLLFMLVSLLLFQIEDRATSKATIKKVEESKSREVLKEDKTEKIIKRPYKHHYRYSNLC